MKKSLRDFILETKCIREEEEALIDDPELEEDFAAESDELSTDELDMVEEDDTLDSPEEEEDAIVLADESIQKNEDSLLDMKEFDRIRDLYFAFSRKLNAAQSKVNVTGLTEEQLRRARIKDKEIIKLFKELDDLITIH